MPMSRPYMLPVNQAGKMLEHVSDLGAVSTSACTPCTPVGATRTPIVWHSIAGTAERLLNANENDEDTGGKNSYDLF